MWKFINGQLVWVKDSFSFRRSGKFNNLKINCEGEGEGGGGSSGEDYKAKFEASDASAKKLEQKNKEVLAENKAFRDQMKAWEGLDPAHVRNLLQKIEGDEELKLITEGKHDEVIKKRTEKVEATYKAQLKTLEEKNREYETKLTESDSRIKKLIIDNNIVTKFASAKGLDTATDDVVARAHQIFKIENGEAIPRDPKTGEIIQGKNGIMTQDEWIESLRVSAPHLFPAGESGGPRGNAAQKGVSDIDVKIEAARKAGDTNELRRLKNEKNSASRRK